MDRLPLELTQRVLTHLDLTSLRNAALSCRIFYDAFQNAEVIITSEILLRQIHPDVLPEAMMVNKSWCLGNTSVESATTFVDDYLKERIAAPIQWKLVDALPLERFHRFVDYFSEQFSSEALQIQPRLVVPGRQRPSRTEINRFERAFYRFQLFCNVVGRDTISLSIRELQGLWDLFFRHFSPWENEQLASIHDFLVRLVAKPFNYLVDHDVTWGYLQVRYIDRYFSDYGQALLSRGLEFIYQLSTASTYQQWHDLLSKGEGRDDDPDELYSFLEEGLSKAASRQLSDIEWDLTDWEDYELVMGPPFYNDPDSGPETIWRWVSQASLPSNAVASSYMARHRQWAHTFWDFSRLQNAGLLQDPSVAKRDNSDKRLEIGLEEYNTPERKKCLEESQKSRAGIWSGGGEGWWSATDQSKVVGYHEYPKSIPCIRNLDEAKTFLRELSEQKD